jgi:hypothetical protein
MRLTRSIVFAATFAASLLTGLVACQNDSSSSTEPLSNPTTETGAPDGSFTPASDAGTDTGATETDAGTDAGKVLEDGLIDPIPYTSRADSPFEGIVFGSYLHFEDWEDSELNTPGVTSSSDQLGTAFGAALVDSIDGDDGVVDGKCAKVGGTCNSAFGNGTIEFTFDAAALGALPTHVGIAWTDGATGCDAIFEAFDANDVSLGTKTATAVGDDNNTGGVGEDRFFAVVHSAGVKRIVVKSSAGGVEVDHLTYGR